MMKQRFLLGLILIMVITPVSSAFGYYSGVASPLSAEFSFEQTIAVADSTDATPDHAEHCRQQDKFKIACHTSGSCTFHVCGDGGIAAVFSFTQAYSSHRYEHLEKSSSRSLSFSPAIRPPINNA